MGLFCFRFRTSTRLVSTMVSRIFMPLSFHKVLECFQCRARSEGMPCPFDAPLDSPGFIHAIQCKGSVGHHHIILGRTPLPFQNIQEHYSRFFHTIPTVNIGLGDLLKPKIDRKERSLSLECKCFKSSR